MVLGTVLRALRDLLLWHSVHAYCGCLFVFVVCVRTCVRVPFHQPPALPPRGACALWLRPRRR